MNSVDVVVPCYRYGAFLEQCVTSVLTQAGVSVRVLVIDDASPDDSGFVAESLAARDERVLCWRHVVNRGHIATYNEGIEWASADYFLLLSADDYLLPGALERAVCLMERNSKLGFVFGNAIEIDGPSTTPILPLDRLKGDRVMTWREFAALSGSRNIVPCQTAVIRTKLQKSVGGYRADLPHSGDMEMWLRLAIRADVGFVDHSQAVCRRHSANMSIAYRTKNWLPDARQRKAALDCFFALASTETGDIESLRRRIYSSFARDVVHLASAAFNDEDVKNCEELLSYALDVDLSVSRTCVWQRVALKRWVGNERWRSLQRVCNAYRNGIVKSHSS